MPVLSNFRIVDNFYLWEAYQAINNGRTIDQFRIVDNYYLYIEILTFSPSAELWIPGAGLESARLKNTLSPNDASGDHSVAEGSFNTISAGADNSHAEGSFNTVNADNSHAECSQNIINVGASYSHIEGRGNIINSTGLRSHVEGSLNIVTAEDGHAEGNGNEILLFADQGHVEGSANKVAGAGAHAEGNSNQANGDFSHAQNSLVIADGNFSHAGGRSGTITKEVLASGSASFNHSENTGAQIAGHGARGANSAILGGKDADVDAASPRSVSLGGSLNKIVGEPDTAQAQNLRVTADLKITQGANKNAGTSAALVGGTLVVANTAVKTGAIILLTHKTQAGVPGALSNPTIVNATSFTITSSSGTDTSTVNFLIINP